jgi:hypothetical protein
MIEPNNLDPIGAAALVMRAIEDIDQTSDEERETLLHDLLRASWASVLAQSQ